MGEQGADGRLEAIDPKVLRGALAVLVERGWTAPAANRPALPAAPAAPAAPSKGRPPDDPLSPYPHLQVLPARMWMPPWNGVGGARATLVEIVLAINLVYAAWNPHQHFSPTPQAIVMATFAVMWGVVEIARLYSDARIATAAVEHAVQVQREKP